jgi:4-diphosphocytidyl-2-C-methyl-D-erythritol kinase
MPLQESARAKVNLFLHVTGRRADGYHVLDSLAVFPAVGDVLTAVRAADFSLTVTGPFAPALAAETDNLVLRAARALAALGHVRDAAALTLVKNLPVASGIGGGSADAAATLRLLGRLWRAPCAGADLMALALRLGADVPACVLGEAVRMGGVGEQLAPAPTLPDFGMLLVHPGQNVRTPEVFHRRQGPFSPPARLPERWADARAMAADLALLHNDLEEAARGLCPAIAEVLAALRATPGCLLARMSGSGATCFGLFVDAAAAQTAAATLRHTGWWVWGGAC